MAKDSTRDLTVGSPAIKIVTFTIPLLFGNLFQQFYNMVDSAIVGRFIGVSALAAVGGTGALSFLVMGLIFGIAGGFMIPVSQAFGAKDMKQMRIYVANAIWLAAILGGTISAFTVIFCRSLLTMIRCPEDIFEASYSYIVTIFAGILASVFYNMLGGIMRALGDSKTPLYFLIFSSLLNVVLDLVFILALHLGVFGAALATVLAQLVSALLCARHIIKKLPICHPQKEEWRLDLSACKTLLGIGLPMGLQFSITAIGSTVLQSAINSLGSSAVASVTAGSKVNFIFQTPIETLGVAMATYAGQNYGARKMDRLRQGIRSAVIMGFSYCILAACVEWFTAQYVAQIFIKAGETDILANVVGFARTNCLFYIPLCMILIFRNVIQGLGRSSLAMSAGVVEMFARSFVAFVLVSRFGLTAIYFANPTAWVTAGVYLALLSIPVLRRVDRELKMPPHAAPAHI